MIFIECRTEEQAIAITEKNDGSYTITVDNIKYKVNVFMEDGATTVRIHDVSPQTENSSIEKELEKYGDVVWLKEEVWVKPAVLKGITNGIRSIRIRLHTAIPSYINVNGEVTLVTYKHQQQTCRHCNKQVHWGRKCVEASYMELQINGGNVSDRLRASGVDYAGALKAPRAGSGKLPHDRNKDGGDSGTGLNYTNLGNLFAKPTNQGQGKSGLSLTGTSKKTLSTNHTNNTTNTNSEAGSYKPVNNESGLDVARSTEVYKGSSSGTSIPLANPYEELISDDEMIDSNTEGYQSPTRKKRNISKKSST